MFFILLVLIGGNMIKESFSKESSEKCNDCVDFKTMIILAIATSIDALAVGITFAFLQTNILLAVTIIGVITFFISLMGVKIGNSFGNKYEKKAEPCCIHCGKCVSVCPMHLEPVYLSMFSKASALEKCLDYNIMSCMECGSCSYICPGNVPIVQYIREAKDKIKAKQKK